MTSSSPEKEYPWVYGPRIKNFILRLGQAGIGAGVVPGSSGPYAVKVRVGTEKSGSLATIYHSPKRKTYKIDLRDVRDPVLRSAAEEAWHGESGRPGKGYHIYADGSFINGYTGYGAVILRDNSVVKEISGPVSADKAASTRQVAGEIKGVENALKWCLDRGVDEVTVHYDYEGLCKWVKGVWRARMPLTREYRDFVLSSGMNITWKKVSAHSGDRWNEYADRLAKKGAKSGRP